MDRFDSFIIILLGVFLVVIGLGVIGLALLCATVQGCAIDVSFDGIPAVGLAVGILFVGAALIAGGAVAHRPPPVH